MKISGGQYLPVSSRALDPTPDCDIIHKKTIPSFRKTRTPKLSTRIGKNGAPNCKRSRPETPLLRWKLDEKVKVEYRDRDVDVDEKSENGSRKERKGKEVVVAVSARKLAAGLWRLQFPQVVAAVSERSGVKKSERSGVKKSEDQLGFKPGVSHVGVPFPCHPINRPSESEAEDLVQSPNSVSGPRNGFLSKLEPSFQFSNTAMEGATKWDPICSKTADDIHRFYGYMKPIEQQEISAVSLVSALETELEQIRARVQELEIERKSSKRKIEHFLKKVSEERSEWRRREHEKVRAIIDDFKADLNRERKNRQRMEMVSSKLVNELAEAKLSAKRFMQDYEKERKARRLIEEVCDELAKEIGEDKTEVEALKRESMKIREEVEDERRMLQMAELWREERVQMKLVDAKVAIEEKYSQMKKLVADLETFLRSKTATPDVKEMREAGMLQQAAASVNIQEVTKFSYEPPNPDDIFSVFEDVNFGELTEREIGPCVAYSPASHASKIHTVSPEVGVFNKDCIQRHSNAYLDQDGDTEDDGSGWETVSQIEDQDSSYSPEGSSGPSVNKIRRDSIVSGSGTDWEDNAGEKTPITEIGEVCLLRSRQMKKSSSISRLWRSNNGENYKIISVEGNQGMNGRLSNGRISNESIHSSDQGSGKGGLRPPDLVEQWSLPDSGNPHITKGIKGRIEWPLCEQKNSLKARLSEARMESQKVQLRQVLNQKI